VSVLKPFLKPARLRKAAALILAGFTCAGGGFPAATGDGTPPGAFFSIAMAHDGRGRDNGWSHDGGDRAGYSGRSHDDDRGSRNGSGDFSGHDRDTGSHDTDRSGGDRNSGSHDADRSGGDKDGGNHDADRNGGDRKGADGKTSSAHSTSDDSGANSGNLSFDANRNMMKLDFNVGWGERRDRLEGHRLEPEHHQRERDHEGRNRHKDDHDHDHQHSHDCDHHHHHHHDGDRDHEHRKIREHLRHATEDWKEEQSMQTLSQTLNPITPTTVPALENDTPVDSIVTRETTNARNERNNPAQHNGKDFAANGKLAIGHSSFMPREVLAVGVDHASMKRAEALGFRADPHSVTSKASNHTITRFTVPPGLDAIGGQALLSRELPGQRFELNKVYRLYHPSEGEEQNKPAAAPSRLLESGRPLDSGKPLKSGEPLDCGADRCVAWQTIGWSDTLATCARGLKVGVIDTDIEETHPAFAGRTIHRFDFSEGHGAPPNWHGTAVMSLLAGNPSGGAPGLIPNSEFFNANIFFSDEQGEMAADTMSLLKALDWMQTFDVKLVNMSFAGPRDKLVAEAIAKLRGTGMIFVAAA
jgi:hypothetical protein